MTRKNDTNTASPLLRKRRKDGLVVRCVGLHESSLDPLSVYRSEDGSYEVLLKEPDGLLTNLVLSGIALAIVTMFVFSDRYGVLWLQLATCAVFWLPVIWWNGRNALRLWQHPVVRGPDDSR